MMGGERKKKITSNEAEGLRLKSAIFFCLCCFCHPETNTENWLECLFQSTMPYSLVILFRFFFCILPFCYAYLDSFPLCLLLDFCEMLPLPNGDQKLKILSTNNSNTIILCISSCLPSNPSVHGRWMWVLISKFETYFKRS